MTVENIDLLFVRKLMVPAFKCCMSDSWMTGLFVYQTAVRVLQDPLVSVVFKRLLGF